MDELTKLRVMRLLSEAQDRTCNVCYETLPTKLHNRAETIRNKLVDLLEEIREIKAE